MPYGKTPTGEPLTMPLNLSKRTRGILTAVAIVGAGLIALPGGGLPQWVQILAAMSVTGLAAVGIVPPAHDTITDVAKRAQALGLHVTPGTIRAETQRHAAASRHLSGEHSLAGWSPQLRTDREACSHASLVIRATNGSTGQEIIRYPEQFFPAVPGEHAVLKVDISNVHPLDGVDFHVHVVNHDGQADVTDASESERG